MNHKISGYFDVNLLQPIDPQKLSQIEESVSRAIRSEPLSKLTGDPLHDKVSRDKFLVKLENWIAVPTLTFPDATLIFNQQEQIRSIAGDRKLYAIVLPIYGNPDFSDGYEVPSTQEGIQEFISTMPFSPMEPVLFSGEPQLDWIIASSEAEYHIVAGTPEPVEYLLGCTAEKSFADFRAFTDHYDDSKSASVLSQGHKYHNFMCYRYYNFIYEQLSSYQSASTGSKVFLTLSS